MLGQKRYIEQGNAPTMNTSRNMAQQTPRHKNKPNIPLPNSRRSVTPSRVQERVTASPLRMPLEKAIEKCTRQKSLERPSSRSRVTNRSSRQGDSSIIYRRGAPMYEEQQSMQSLRRYHDETIIFLKKYFDYQYPIPKEHFIDKIIHQYGEIWRDHNTEQFLHYFTWKIVDLFGDSIEPRDLLEMTQNDGMIGLILQICQHIQESRQIHQNSRSNYTVFSKSPNIMSINKSFEQQVSECVNVQTLKNILQQFMQTMYHQMQKEIYDKFNIEMKRMVLKHKETDRMLKKINQKVINNADFFQSQKKWQNKIKSLEQTNSQLLKNIEKQQEQIKRQKQGNSQLKNIKYRLQDEINKLKESNQKYQNILLHKFQNIPTHDNIPSYNTTPISYSRKIPSNAPLMDRTQEFNNQNMGFQSQPKPFQIKIDTQIIHRDSAPPIPQSMSAFPDKNVNMPLQNAVYPLSDSNLSTRCYSPIKINSQPLDSGRPSFEGGIKPGTKIGEYVYSPYQGKTSRIN